MNLPPVRSSRRRQVASWNWLRFRSGRIKGVWIIFASKMVAKKWMTLRSKNSILACRNSKNAWISSTTVWKASSRGWICYRIGWLGILRTWPEQVRTWLESAKTRYSSARFTWFDTRKNNRSIFVKFYKTIYVNDLTSLITPLTKTENSWKFEPVYENMYCIFGGVNYMRS